MDKLKPCPFCGEQLIFLRGYNQYEHPRNDCFLAMADSEYERIWFDANYARAVKAWNSRVIDNGI